MEHSGYSSIFLAIARSWWVGFFFILSFVFYHYSLEGTDLELRRLESKCDALLVEKKALIETNQDLIAKSGSLNDPKWIEQLLIRELGVVPKGYMKVFFKKEDIGSD